MAGEFSPDGSLRDIYILDADAAGLAALLDVISSARYEPSYRSDGHPAAAPKTFDEIVEIRKRAALDLVLKLSQNFEIDCHFFAIPEIIEFSFRPQDVRGEHEFGRLLAFLADIGTAAQRQVLLTPENLPEHPMLVFQPGNSSWVRM
jgi:hypothetical protein